MLSDLKYIKPLVFSPTKTFNSLGAQSFVHLFKYYATMSLVSTSELVIIWLFVSLLGLIPSQYTGVSGLSIIIFLYLFLLVFGFLIEFISAILSHSFGFILGAREFRKTFTVYVIASAPSLVLRWIPFLNLMGSIISFILRIIGLSELHKISKIKSFVMVIFPMVIILLFITLIYQNYPILGYRTALENARGQVIQFPVNETWLSSQEYEKTCVEIMVLKKSDYSGNCRFIGVHYGFAACDCDPIEPSSDDIAWREAYRNKDVEMCKKIKNYELRWDCVAGLDENAFDISFCQDIADSYKYGLCVSHAAASQKDVSICMTIDDDFRQNGCIVEVAQTTKNVELCNQVQESGLKQTCIANVGIALGDISYCERTTKRDYCLRQIAVLTRNRELCDQITSQEEKEFCLQYF